MHQTFTIAFVDDLLLTFSTWQQADRLAMELRDCLQGLGLQLNLTKTRVMTHASQIQSGRQHAFSTESILANLQWGESCTYLRKTLQHFEVGMSMQPTGPLDTSTSLLTAMGHSCHAAYEALNKSLRKGHWASPRHTLKLCNMYVGGTWYWYSPLLEPLQRHVDAVRCLQVTMLLLLLGLYIPSDLSRAPAIFLNRVRRRLVLVLLGLLPNYDWIGIWLRRRWNYLGHVLRFQPGHITRAAWTALFTVRQACPGPWQHALKWGLAQYNQHIDSDATMQTVEAMARDKDVWNAWGRKVASAAVESHPVVHCAVPEKWQDALRLEVAWRVGAHVCIEASGAYCMTWISAEHGVQSYSDFGGFVEFCVNWVGFMQMEFTALLYDVYMSQDACDILLHQLHAAHGRVYEQFEKVVLYNIVSDAVDRRMRALA